MGGGGCAKVVLLCKSRRNAKQQQLLARIYYHTWRALATRMEQCAPHFHSSVIIDCRASISCANSMLRNTQITPITRASADSRLANAAWMVKCRQLLICDSSSTICLDGLQATGRIYRHSQRLGLALDLLLERMHAASRLHMQIQREPGRRVPRRLEPCKSG